MTSLHTEITLYSTPEHFVLQSPAAVLSINRQNGSISNSYSGSNSGAKGTKIYGVLGTIQLLHTQYLAIITQVERVGVLFGDHEVFRVINVNWLPFNSQTGAMAGNNIDEERYLNLLKSVVDSRAFYFSYTYDMTRSVQNWHLVEQNSSKPFHANADEHFFWNKKLSKNLIDAGADAWVIPIIRGFVEIQNCKLNSGKSFKLSILSRLGTKRVGTRYNIRGLDQQGNAANYAETEQIVETETDLLSFMQLRGSIPLYWTQKPNLKYKPQIKISSKNDSTSGFQLHFKNQLERYQSIVIVNLVNLKGSEKLLADAYETEHKKFGDDKIRYIAFDFHNKCKSMNYGAINELVEQVESNMKDYGYFHYNSQTKTINRQQAGIIRVNCIDCLDRTNVVENVFGRHVITKQLKQLGLIEESDDISKEQQFEKVYKNAWADNGDHLSNLYAGTGALKSDFTRTGKRSLMGLYNDGMNSITRYYLNNFTDGTKQDGINLFLGKYVVDPTASSPFISNSSPVLSLLKYAFFASLFMAALNTSKIPSGK